MISNQHLVEIYVEGQLLELESQESLNLRINNVLFNPTKTTTTQAEYSFSFQIPSTPNNDKIFNYANTLSKVNKFHARYATEVYADGTLIFEGSLTIQKFSTKEKKYTCNLVSIKVNTLEDIFGEMKLTDLKWNVPFSGAPTINSVNADENAKYFFPLVCYGAFQKNYVTADSVGATYTPKSMIDKYNKWWVESFYPSLNVVETMRKAFESKGYNVNGSAFHDPYINGIYASCNLADDQAPIYNLGNPKFGKCSLTVTWNNYYSYNEVASGQVVNTRNEYCVSNSTGGLPQTLKYPYRVVRPLNATSNALPQYNLDEILTWNMLDSTNNPSGVNVTMLDETYMYDPDESVIVIPADGWYRIGLLCNISMSGTPSGTTNYYCFNFDNNTITKREVNIKANQATFKQEFPLEIQLVRNREENVELIKGKWNYTYNDGDPNSTHVPNYVEWKTEFPHQELYGAIIPTKENELVSFDVAKNSRNAMNSSIGMVGGTSNNTMGYMHKDGKPMVYDQSVSPAFICGLTTMGGGAASVMRNGKSWSKITSDKNQVISEVDGYDLITRPLSGETTTSTNYCKNEYYAQPQSTITVNDRNMTGRVFSCVYLKKNDIIELLAIERSFEGKQMYACSGTCDLTITAMSSKSEATLRGTSGWGYYSESDFPRELNLFNFTNSDTKVSEWITNVQKALNLEIINQGDTVEINVNKGVNKDISYAVELDDRLSNDEAESEFISYPKSMAVKYKINTEEYGFELTVPEEHINDEGDTWKEYGDSGFTVIELNDDSYETDKQETSTQFSYTYYMGFDFKQTNQTHTTEQSAKKIRIPVIEKSEYMADGYNDEEAMAHDGYSLTQRFWYRQSPSTDSVYLADHQHEQVYLSYPMNNFGDMNLSYKATEKSLVTEYFNIHPMLSSNYVTVEAYLTPEEYLDIKNGALVRYNNDLHYTSEIKGYDCTGRNKATLKLIKKV